MLCKSNENLFIISCLRGTQKAPQLLQLSKWQVFCSVWVSVCVCLCASVLFHLLSNRKWHAADLFTKSQLCPLSPPLSFFLTLTNTFSLLFMLKSKSLRFQCWFTEIRFWWRLFLTNIYYNMDFWHLKSYKWSIHVYKSVQPSLILDIL